LLASLVPNETGERIFILKGNDNGEIRGAIHCQSGAGAEIDYSACAPKRTRGPQKNILIVDIAGPLERKENDLRHLAAPIGSVGAGRDEKRERKEEADSKRREKMSKQLSHGIIMVAQKTSPSIKIAGLILDEEKCERFARGKKIGLRRQLSQSRIFCAAFKNKVQIFSCRSFVRFLISSRWQRARSSVVNKV